ncbi:MAG: hypothetical protein QOG04_1326 [Actinomycetota bacterium]|jgi:hypothetical protein|nr:hypothetical protein [Actinomycetota bacterium]
MLPDADNPLMVSPHSRALAADERGLIMGWLGKLLIGFLLVAVVIYDGGSILVNFFTLDSTADEIAVELTTNVLPGQLSLNQIQPRAAELAKESGARLVGVSVEGNVVKVTLRRRANTLVIGRIGPIEDWARATVEGQSGTG